MNSDGGIVAARQTMTPEPQPGEHQGVVGLADPVRRAVALDRSERAAGRDERLRRRSTPGGSSGVCSASTVGLDIGRMIGRGQCACIERMTCSVNAPVTPGGADEHRRVQVVDDLLRGRGSRRRARQSATVAGSLAYGCW